ncbi:triose-phosphate isomerase [soil metagenome]
MRQKIVAGNWKMNKNFDEGLKLASELINMIQDEVMDEVKIILAPPFIHLQSISKLISGSKNIVLGAQNCHEKESGAYTGEISVLMLKTVNVSYVIIGHSERRQYFKETNSILAQKIDVLLKNNLNPIFCCGEPLEIREKNQHVEYVVKQLEESLFHLSDDQFKNIVIAYEPIWAIGTGKTASTEQAQEMHAEIRKCIAGKFGNGLADDLTILYGGSCNPQNAPELFACPDVDGGLIGGASLKSRDFTDIIKSFKK